MAKLIRKDGGSVNAYEDAVAFDFAFSGQSGVIESILNELSADISTPNQFKVKSGMGVVQGRQFIVETDEIIPLNTASGSTVYYYIVYVEVNMNAKTALLKSSASTLNYPSFPSGANLNQNPLGTAYLPLYSFKQTSTGIQDLSAVTFRKIKPDEASNVAEGDSSNKIANTRFVQRIKDIALNEVPNQSEDDNSSKSANTRFVQRMKEIALNEVPGQPEDDDSAKSANTHFVKTIQNTLQGNINYLHNITIGLDLIKPYYEDQVPINATMTGLYILLNTAGVKLKVDGTSSDSSAIILFINDKREARWTSIGNDTPGFSSGSKVIPGTGDIFYVTKSNTGTGTGVIYALYW